MMVVVVVMVMVMARYGIHRPLSCLGNGRTHLFGCQPSHSGCDETRHPSADDRNPAAKVIRSSANNDRNRPLTETLHGIPVIKIVHVFCGIIIPATPSGIVFDASTATTYQIELHRIQNPNSTFFH